MATATKQYTRKYTQEQCDKMANAADVLPCKLGGGFLNGLARAFSTGSVGFYASGKVPFEYADGTVVMLQVSLNATVVGSKPE